MVNKALQFLTVLGICTAVAFAFLIKDAKDKMPAQENNTKNQAIPSLNIIAKEVPQPVSIVASGKTIYVGSQGQKQLLKITDGKTEVIANISPYAFIVEPDGSITATIFDENRVVKIDKNGNTKELIGGFAGPSGITKDKQGIYYVTNYQDGTLVSFSKEGKNKKTVLEQLRGPAGIFYDTILNTLFIANYDSGSITEYSLSTKTRVDMLFPGVSHIKSVYVSSGKILATGVVNQKTALVSLDKKTQTFKIIQEVGLPEPVIAYFKDRSVFLASPNDASGRIFTMKLP